MNIVKDMMKYVKSFVYEKEISYNWMSGLLCFVDDGKMVLDSGFIITGDVSLDHYGFYMNYRNFTMINSDLHYMYPDGIKRINSEKVYLHLRFGNSPSPIQTTHLNHWHLYVTSPNNKFFKSIDFNEKRIKCFQEGGNSAGSVSVKIAGDKSKIFSIKNPMFHDKQVYNDHSVMFSSLNTFML